MKLLLLRNGIHRKRYSVGKTSAQLDDIIEAFRYGVQTKKQYQYARYLRRKLCGQRGCQCGNVLGETESREWIGPDDLRDLAEGKL